MKPQTHIELTDAMREELALYAFGLLAGDEAAEWAHHLGAGCNICNDEFQAVTSTVVALSSTVEAMAPPVELKQRLLTRVRGEKLAAAKLGAEYPEPGLYVIRSDAGAWKRTPWEGIAYKRLYLDRETGLFTSLLRVDPGASYPAHRHHGVEQSWVVEGSCRIGSIVIRAGDFACAAAGTEHGTLVSDDGCLLLIVSTAKDEILA